MKAAVLHLRKSLVEGRELETELVVEDIPVPPAPGPNQVLIRMRAVGICGSDVHYWTHGRIGDFVMHDSMVIGHECAGDVVSVGPGVSNVVPGDRVALEPGLPCRQCHHCKTGCYNLCPGMRFFATPPVHGSLCHFVVHDADFCYKLPEKVPHSVGALLEPLSVGVYACRRANITLGSTVLIMGAGPIGCVCAFAAKAFGAARVVIADVNAARVDFASTIAAVDEAIHIAADGDLIRGAADGSGARPDLAGAFSAVFECCGVDAALDAGIRAAAPGATLMVIGMGGAVSKVPLLNAACREVDVRGVFRYRNCYPAALALAASSQAELSRLITHRFGFTAEEVKEGFITSWKGKDRDGKLAIKVMFELE